MITEKYFIESIKNLADIMGQRITVSVANLLYEELKHTDLDDFQRAMVNLKYQDKRITIGSLCAAINDVKSIRAEKENVINRKAEQQRTARFWKENKAHISQGRCNRKCTGCLVKYCDLIHEASIKAMHEIIDGHKTLSQVNAEMSVQFPGWERGFKPEPF